jgi:hypothetical protein
MKAALAGAVLAAILLFSIPAHGSPASRERTREAYRHAAEARVQLARAVEFGEGSGDAPTVQAARKFLRSARVMRALPTSDSRAPAP